MHFNRRHLGRLPQAEVQSHIVAGTVTRAAAYFVHPNPRGPRLGAKHSDPRADTVTIRFDADQMHPEPVVVVLSQFYKQKWKIAHIVDHRFLPPIIPEIADGQTSARL